MLFAFVISTGQYKTLSEEEIEKSENQRMTNRLNKAMKICEEYAKVKNADDIKSQGLVWFYNQKNLAYCITPKVGCTFWKQVFRFIAGDYGPNINVTRPAHIDRMEAHYGELKIIQQIPLSIPIYRRRLVSQKHVNMFMFSRDPYSRLWSAYIDKIFLPDFLGSLSPRIVSTLRPSSTNKEKPCGNDVSFQELIKYVTFKLSKGKNVNDHFNPIYRQCSPCDMRFDVLGKMETFEKDSEYIFDHFDLKNVSNSVSYVKDVKEEVNMLINYNLNLERYFTGKCYNRTVVALRLWQVFQYNGYLSKNKAVPQTYIQTIANGKDTAQLFQELVLKTIAEQNVDHASLRQQKREYLVKAYKVVPWSDLRMIPKLYQPDFELFDYEKYPEDIFQTIQ